MKKLILLLAALAGTGMLSYAQVGTFPGCPGAFGPTKLITGTTEDDTTSSIRKPGGKVFWVNDTIYIIKRNVNVAANTTLEIEQGTIVMGFPYENSTLIIKQGAKLNALGDVNNPVVMTSCKIQGGRNRGDWGGLVICGNGVNNYSRNLSLFTENGVTHGGNNPEDNSGVIQYLRVEFAGGFFYIEDDNLRPKINNGITLASVGVRTAFRNVQVSFSGNDSFRWIGGSANGRFLISNKCANNDFEADLGYNGLLQFGISLRDNTTGDFHGSNCIAIDKQYIGGYPPTSTIFSNFTNYGPLAKKGSPYNKFLKTGAILYQNNEVDIYNTVFAGWPGDTTVNDGVQTGKETGGIYIQQANAANNAISGAIRAKRTLLYNTLRILRARLLTTLTSLTLNHGS